MSTHQGKFVWCELATPDAAAAARFYGGAIGWTAADSGMPGVRYTILNAGMSRWAAWSSCRRTPGHGPAGSAYIAVDDVDAMAARVTAAGGAIHRGPDDIPNVGRFAFAADPQGAAFVLFRPLPGGPPQVPAGATPGRVGWHELHAGEWTAAFDFYSGLFGWTKTQAVDMGPMGTYQTFATADAAPGEMTGGMMTKMPGAPGGPAWLYYFNVAAVDAAVERVKAGGGQLLNGPHEVPGGAWIAQCLDPQGTMFAMVGPTR